MSARFEAELASRINEEAGRLRDDLEAGLAIKDYAQYQNYIGKLAAYRRVLTEFYDDVQTKLNKE